MEVSGQLHAPAALPQEKNPQYPLGRRLSGHRAGLEAMLGRKNPMIAPAGN